MKVVGDGAAALHLGDPHHRTSLRVTSPVGTQPIMGSLPYQVTSEIVLKALSSTAGRVGIVSGLSMEKNFMLHTRTAGKLHWKDDVKPGEYMPKPLCSGSGGGFHTWGLISLKC